MMNILFRNLKLERTTFIDVFILLGIFTVVSISVNAYHGFYESMVVLFIMVVGFIVMLEMDNILDDSNNPKLALFINLKHGTVIERVWFLIVYIIIYMVSFIATTILFPIKIVDLILRYYRYKRGDKNA